MPLSISCCALAEALFCGAATAGASAAKTGTVGKAAARRPAMRRVRVVMHS
jgi:hypothetical protein